MDITLYPGANWPDYDYAIQNMFPGKHTAYHHRDTIGVVKLALPTNHISEQQLEYLGYLMKWEIISNYEVTLTFIGIL